MKRSIALLALVIAMTSALPAHVSAAQSAQAMYTRALTRERTLREDANKPTLKALRSAIAAYEAIVHRYPASGYCDNALWQAGNLAVLAYNRFGQAADKRTALRLFAQLKTGYPASSLVARINDAVGALAHSAPAPAPARAPAPGTALRAPSAPPAPFAPSAPTVTPSVPSTASIRDIKRVAIENGVRVTIEMDRESLFYSERLENPRRVFFDLKAARPVASLLDATLKFEDDVVREIRLGRHPQNTTRVVMDLDGIDDYSVFTLYEPFRLVIDFRRTAAPKPVTASTPELPLARRPEPPPAPRPEPPSAPVATTPVPLASRPAPSLPAAPKVPDINPVEPPAANSNGHFSLARQLGLGISRIVIDAGHGGHDPGAKANGLSEAELVLDVALRLRKLLLKQAGVEVVMTRETDVFIPLDERTAIANREGADLFLSIHANASRNAKARGVETYFLNFASNPEAEAVAARENSSSGHSMHRLPEIVRAIALNNKIDESRDFADMVQTSMVRRLSARNKQLRNLGVKQAPFVVLIGATMPSVLAEISFVTNKQEGTLLKTGAYRQQIAEALFEAIVRYQKSLKKITAVAAKEQQ